MSPAHFHRSTKRESRVFWPPASTPTPTPTAPVFYNICDRNYDIQKLILESTPAHDECGSVSSSNLAAVTELDFRGKYILTLNDDDFQGLTNLRKLDLRNTNRYGVIFSIKPDAFAGLENLEELYMPSTPYKYAPLAFLPLTSLTTLNGQPWTRPASMPQNLT